MSQKKAAPNSPHHCLRIKKNWRNCHRWVSQKPREVDSLTESNDYLTLAWPKTRSMISSFSSATCKTTWKSENITFTNNKERLSKEDIKFGQRWWNVQTQRSKAIFFNDFFMFLIQKLRLLRVRIFFFRNMIILFFNNNWFFPKKMELFKPIEEGWF